MVNGMHRKSDGVVWLASAGDPENLKGTLRVNDGDSAVTSGTQQINAVSGECNRNNVRHFSVASVFDILRSNVKGLHQTRLETRNKFVLSRVITDGCGHVTMRNKLKTLIVALKIPNTHDTVGRCGGYLFIVRITYHIQNPPGVTVCDKRDFLRRHIQHTHAAIGGGHADAQRVARETNTGNSSTLRNFGQEFREINGPNLAGLVITGRHDRKAVFGVSADMDGSNGFAVKLK